MKLSALKAAKETAALWKALASNSRMSKSDVFSLYPELAHIARYRSRCPACEQAYDPRLGEADCDTCVLWCGEPGCNEPWSEYKVWSEVSNSSEARTDAAQRIYCRAKDVVETLEMLGYTEDTEE